MKLAGILPAVVTPIDDNEQFVAPVFEKLLDRLYSAGVHGIYVSGNTGEGLSQPLGDRGRLIEAAVRYSPPGKLVIAHVGAYRTADAVWLAKHAAKAGVSAISSLPPLGQYSFPEVRQYYSDLASAADLPVIVYYYPHFSQAISSLAAQRELLEIPGVAGIKFTGFDLYSLSRLKNTGATVFNGHDEVLAAGLLMGADGGIGSFYNLVPELLLDIYANAQSGDWEGARTAQARLNELIEITLEVPYLSAIKLMLRWSGLDCGCCFAPRLALTKTEESLLAERLSRSSFAERAFAAPGR